MFTVCPFDRADAAFDVAALDVECIFSDAMGLVSPLFHIILALQPKAVFSDFVHVGEAD